MANFHHAECVMEIFQRRITIEPYGVLGTQKVVINSDTTVEVPYADGNYILKPNTAIVDPAGTEFIIENRPSDAGLASRSIYDFFKILAFNNELLKYFRDKFKNKNKNNNSLNSVEYNNIIAGESKFDIYIKNGYSYTIIHTIGYNFGNITYEDLFDQYDQTYKFSLEKLSEAYKNTLKQFILSLKENKCNILRLLPISGGGFAGALNDSIPKLTMYAFYRGLQLLELTELNVIITNKIYIEMCIFNDNTILQLYVDIWKEILETSQIITNQHSKPKPKHSIQTGLTSNDSRRPRNKKNTRRNHRSPTPANQSWMNFAYNTFAKKPYNIFAKTPYRTLKLASNVLSNQLYSNNTNNGINRFTQNKKWTTNYALYASDLSFLSKSKTIFSDYTNEELAQMVNQESQVSNDYDISAVNKLILIHNLTINSILYELKNGPKVNHYMWWICPFLYEAGKSDPLDTYVNQTTYTDFLSKINLNKWIKVLNIIAGSRSIITEEFDILRIRRFCDDWKTLDLKHWHALEKVISKLEKDI
jgi:hypothetical protein